MNGTPTVIPPGKVRNLPIELGRESGKQMVRIFGQSPDCCVTCAFRLGSAPNGSEATVNDALKCVMENVEFMCHDGLDLMAGQEPWKTCAGWIHARNHLPKGYVAKMPFPFSDEVTKC